MNKTRRKAGTIAALVLLAGVVAGLVVVIVETVRVVAWVAGLLTWIAVTA